MTIKPVVATCRLNMGAYAYGYGFGLAFDAKPWERWPVGTKVSLKSKSGVIIEVGENGVVVKYDDGSKEYAHYNELSKQ